MADLKITGRWREFERALDADAFRRRLEHQIEIAHTRIGRMIIKKIRRSVQARAFAPDSPVTIALKGSSKPLVHHGDLLQSITYDGVRTGPPTARALRIGVIKRKAGEKMVDIARILHDGATVDTARHPQVRRAVFAKLRESVSAERMRALNARQRPVVAGAARTLGLRAGGRSNRSRAAMFARMRAGSARGGGTGLWVIPARPFITRTIGDPQTYRTAQRYWSAAIRAALTEEG